MLAIHNRLCSGFVSSKVANAFAKLSKCQQFTTFCPNNVCFSKLQTLLQSYQNVSNSQLMSDLYLFYECCKRFCKVIKMLAIHNAVSLVNLPLLVANAFAKLSKCQQFTTVTMLDTLSKTLQTLLQSYQNVSNSQPIATPMKVSLSCKRFCKVIKMLAIHNKRRKKKKHKYVANAFAKLSKCQQFTTIHLLFLFLCQLQTLLQSYQNVSNSQL